MNSEEIRKLYLKFFEERQHLVIPSSSLVPADDPTLLLTTAGMVQIKPYFLGIAKPSNRRLASCQKCFRTTDIDSVGDAKHLTFFEMLGNFSVGDYFKQEAIEWGWEFVTRYLKINPENLRITVFQDDDEAFNIWRSIGIPEEKISRCGARDNFWGPAGNSGPCGPCSEIHYDFGAGTGCGQPECNPSCGCERFLEIWNLVFTQYNQDVNGNRTSLPRPNIDTGMGLERVTAVLENVKSVYETDLFVPIIDSISKICGVKYGQSEDSDNALRVIAEHSRGLCFLIADGVLPSNEGRGYVLRRILRRASFFGRKIGLDKPFLYEMTQSVIQKMGVIYPELVRSKSFIEELVKNEEEKFGVALDTGINIVQKLIEEAKSQNIKMIDGSEVFRLYDTYGFPSELTAEIAGKRDLSIDFEGFEAEMVKQRDKARASHKFESTVAAGMESKISIQPTEFIGYENLFSISKVNQLIDIDKGDGDASILREGQKLGIVLDRTPFYGEKGGQLGDTGEIISKDGVVKITNSTAGDSIIELIGTVIKGQISIGDEVEAKVDAGRRADIARNHTATHLLQAALREVLGSHVHQRGSLVAPDRLRFDFSHLKEITDGELNTVQEIVNEKIRQNLKVETRVLSYKEAVNSGATAIFEEKYGEFVRVLKIGEPAFSMELCGGTHVSATGEIGYFFILSESSIGSGLRRIEAVTGREAERIINERFRILDEISVSTNASISDAPKKVRLLAEELKNKMKQIESLERKQSKNLIDELISQKETVNGINLIASVVPSSSMSTLREMGDSLRDKVASSVIVLGSVYDGKPALIAMVTPDLAKRGVHAGDLIKQVAMLVGGSGGGRAEAAQAGGKDASKVGDAINSVKPILANLKLK